MFSKKLKDVDSANRAQNLHALGYSMYGGAVFGGAGFLVGGVVTALIAWAAGTAVIYFISVVVAGGLGSGAATLYGGSGSSTPAKREYSRGDALNAHGNYDEAVAEYERCALQYADDPEPRLRLARMLRDRMQRHEDAAQWFRQVLAIEGVETGVWVQTARELAELYTHRVRQPERALPILALLNSRYPTTAAGQWARAQITEIKREMREAQ